MKQRIAFALLMGIVTTGSVTFMVILVNLGLNGSFLKSWLKSWAVAYLTVIPLILIVSPLVERLVKSLLGETTTQQKSFVNTEDRI